MSGSVLTNVKPNLATLTDSELIDFVKVAAIELSNKGITFKVPATETIPLTVETRDLWESLGIAMWYES